MAYDVVCCAELVVTCELLCYLVFFKGKCEWINNDNGFFLMEELELAKNNLFDIAKEAYTSLGSRRFMEPFPRQ